MEKFKPLLKPFHTNEDNKLRKLGSTLPEDAFTVSDHIVIKKNITKCSFIFWITMQNFNQ